MKGLFLLGFILSLSVTEGSLNKYLDLMQARGIDWASVACNYPAKKEFLAYYDTKENLKTCNLSEKQGILDENFHLVDVNQDGLLDIIFEAGCPYYARVKIFLNKGNELEKVLDEPGKLIQLETLEEKTLMTIRMDACCCINNNSLRWFELPVSDFNVELKHDLEWHHAFKVPNRSMMFQEMPATSNFSLRYEPVINDEITPDSCSDRFIKGNVVGEFKEGSRLKLWSTKQNAAGETWAMVTIPPSESRLPSQQYAQEGDIPGKTSYMGWVLGSEIGLN